MDVYQHIALGNPKHGLVELIGVVINLICDWLCPIMGLGGLLFKLWFCIIWFKIPLDLQAFRSHYHLNLSWLGVKNTFGKVVLFTH